MTAKINLIAINIGNSRIQLGVYVEGELTRNEHFDHENLTACVEGVVSGWQELGDRSHMAIAIASVHEALAQKLASAIRDQLSVEVNHVGSDMPVPIGTQLNPETITGVDRLLNAAAAFDTIKQACIVIDAGTAVTIDFVDGDGTFQGGAIAPGARLQLQCLHEQTDALPELIFAQPDVDPFGRSTAQAMLRGVYHGIRGMVWKLVEQYAEAYEAYPTVIATGGDAQTLFHDDELIDRIVPDLTLHGIMVTARDALVGQTDEDIDVRRN
ncbi:MAG: type III pantothenate kinase [Planctomycetota bacterium]|nr:type III pantothenate kinase [Planctomycetota bacterium]